MSRTRIWTRNTILTQLQTIGKLHGTWLTMTAWTYHHYRPDPSIILREFGHWRTAWQTAGFIVPPWNKHPLPRDTWNRARILTALQQAASPQGTVPTSSQWARTHHSPALRTITHWWNSYAAAVKAAGLTIVDTSSLSQAQWTEALHQLTQNLGYPPNRREWDAWPERPASSRAVWKALGLPSVPHRSHHHAALWALDLDHIDNPHDRTWVLAYRNGQSFAAIAHEAGVSREWVRQRLLALLPSSTPLAYRTPEYRDAARAATTLLADPAATTHPLFPLLHTLVHSPNLKTWHRSSGRPVSALRRILQALVAQPERWPSLSLDPQPPRWDASAPPAWTVAALQPLRALPGWSPRTLHALDCAQIVTLADLLHSPDATYQHLPGLGPHGQHEVQVQRAILRSVYPSPMAPSPQPLPSEGLLIQTSLSVRAQHCLAHAHIDTLSALRQQSADELLHIPNLGRGTLREIQRFLETSTPTIPSLPR